MPDEDNVYKLRPEWEHLAIGGDFTIKPGGKPVTPDTKLVWKTDACIDCGEWLPQDWWHACGFHPKRIVLKRNPAGGFLPELVPDPKWEDDEWMDDFEEDVPHG